MPRIEDKGNELHLFDESGRKCAAFTKPGHCMHPQGGVYSINAVLIDMSTAINHFKRHLATSPARTASTVGERVTT